MNYLEKLKLYEQLHILKYVDELSLQQKNELIKQIESLDFSYLNYLKFEQKKDYRIEPINSLNYQNISKNKEKFEKIGINALKSNKIGVLLLAGGMGTRLGFDKPKGMLNIGITKDVFIFQRLIENLQLVTKKIGFDIPLFIMTSEKNNDQTIEFFEQKNFFGYNKNMVKFFVQEMAPCVDFNGKILMESKCKIAISPNGNGGCFKSLLNNKEAKDLLIKSNLEYLNIVSVDNVLQMMADPILIGAVIDGNYQVGAKVIKKINAEEKVGLICKKNGRPAVVEYSDAPKEITDLLNKNGELVFNYGVTLNYLFRLDLLNKLNNSNLPIHIVSKKIDCINENGQTIKPEIPNGYKFEYLNVDMIEFAENCLSFEVLREKEFAPIKNKEGKDSIETARQLLIKNGYSL